MKSASVILAPGFEEGEALTIVDILRRAQLRCDLVGFSQQVEGAHHITVQCDHTLDSGLSEYDMVILPGGLPGAFNLRDNPKLIEELQQQAAKGSYICAICAAPIVLNRAGLLQSRHYTAYPGYEEKISDGIYLDKSVVIDGKIVTSRAPATAYAFAYQLAELLGGDAEAVKQRMVYDHAFEEKEESVWHAQQY